MKSPLPILLLSLASLLCGCATERFGADANSNRSDTAYVKPTAFVLYRTNASPGVVRLADQISSAYGLREPQSVADNPLCCVWLEVKSSDLRPGVPYYSVTVLDSGDTWLYASSQELLEKAVHRLEESAHSQSGQLVVPVGKFSYYAE